MTISDQDLATLTNRELLDRVDQEPAVDVLVAELAERLRTALEEIQLMVNEAQVTRITDAPMRRAIEAGAGRR